MPELVTRFSGPGVRSSLRDGGELVHEDDRQYVARVVERAKPFADLDVGEASALAQPILRLREHRIGHRCANRQTGKRQHHIVRRGVVAVDAHLAERFNGWRLCQRLLDGQREDAKAIVQRANMRRACASLITA